MENRIVSVIIVAYRGADRLRMCLSGLASEGTAWPGFAVTVVNNSRGDEGIIKLKSEFPSVSFHDSDVNGGFGHGCNLGASLTVGEWILFLNPDTVASPLEVMKLAGEAASAHCMIASCRQIRSDGKESVAWGDFPRFSNMTGLMRAVARLFSPRRGKTLTDGEIFRPDWVSGSVLLIRRKDFELLGGFDEDYWMYYEDVDLCRRAADAGGATAFFRNITVEHNHGGSSRINAVTTSLTKTEVIISRHLYVTKHFRGSGRFGAQVFLTLNHLLSAFFPALAGAILPFVPKLRVRTLIFGRLAAYYLRAAVRGTWKSPRAAGA